MQAYSYKFRNQDHLNEAQDTMLLALLAAEGLFGRCRVRMDAAWAADETINVIVIDAQTLVGTAVSLIFTAFLNADIGADAFDVRRVEILAAFVAGEVCR